MKKASAVSGFVLILVLIGGILAQSIDIEIGQNYFPGDSVSFKINVYEKNQKIKENVNFEIQDYYTEVIEKGTVTSDEKISFTLPDNAIRGYWAIVARYKGLEKKELFNVMELERANIQLNGDELVVTNAGNVPYKKPIQISIGNHEETALVPLGIGETKKIKLTAPEGEYDIRVSDGTNYNNLEFKGVSLTGKVIGLEKSDKGNFFQENKMISLFLIVIGGLIVILFFRALKKN